MVLAELDLPHEIEPVAFDSVKKPEFTKINPNGRFVKASSVLDVLTNTIVGCQLSTTLTGT